KSRRENPRSPELSDPVLRELDLFRRHEEVLAEAIDDRESDPLRNEIAESRPDPAPQGAGQNHTRETHAPLRCPESGGRHHDLRGNRNNGTFHRHQDENAEVTPGFHPSKPRSQELVKHGYEGSRAVELSH